MSFYYYYFFPKQKRTHLGSSQKQNLGVIASHPDTKSLESSRWQLVKASSQREKKKERKKAILLFNGVKINFSFISHLKLLSSQQVLYFINCQLALWGKTVPNDKCMQKFMSSLLYLLCHFMPTLASHQPELCFLVKNVHFPISISWMLTVLWVLCCQAADAELPSPPADSTAHHSSRGQLLPYADLHDVQWIPLHSCGSRGRDGLFLLQLEKGSCCGYHWALPLTLDAAQKPLHPTALLKCSHHVDWIIPKLKEKIQRKSTGVHHKFLAGVQGCEELEYAAPPCCRLAAGLTLEGPVVAVG